MIRGHHRHCHGKSCGKGHGHKKEIKKKKKKIRWVTKTSRYLWDLAAPVTEVLGTTDQSGNPQASYLYGLERISGTNASGQTYYYMTDRLGSVTGLLTSSGLPRTHYTYDPFGAPNGAVRFDPAWPGPGNVFGYNGQMYDYVAGTYDLRAREYMPSLGQFLSPDPYPPSVADPMSFNGYPYVLDNPFSNVDPLGLHPLRYSGSVIEQSVPVWETVVSNGLDVVPGVGNVKSGIEAFTGQDLVTGQPLSPSDRVLAGAGVLLGSDRVVGKAGEIIGRFGEWLLPKIGEVANSIGEGAKAAFQRLKDETGSIGKADGTAGVDATAKGTGNIDLSVKPTVSNQKLQNAVNQLYRPGATAGNGSTADAIRHELGVGELVGGKSHIQKGLERVKNIENILRTQHLNPHDKAVAEALLQDLNNALNGK